MPFNDVGLPATVGRVVLSSVTSYCYWATVKDAATLAFEVLRDIILERLGTQFIRLQAWVAVAVDTNDRL